MAKENDGKKENKINFAKKIDTSQSSLARIVARLNDPSTPPFQSNIYSTSFEKKIKLEEEINKIKPVVHYE